jgi:hypothetical protein
LSAAFDRGCPILARCCARMGFHYAFPVRILTVGTSAPVVSVTAIYRQSIRRLRCVVLRRWTWFRGWGWGGLAAEFLKPFPHVLPLAFVCKAATLTIERMRP